MVMINLAHYYFVKVKFNKSDDNRQIISDQRRDKKLKSNNPCDIRK